MVQLTIVDTSRYVAALVGEMPAEPCEHSQHPTRADLHDNGPATHYVSTGCPGCDMQPKVIAACEKWVNGVSQNKVLTCDCGLAGPASLFVKVLGPVGSLS